MRCFPNASHSPRVSARIVAFTSFSGIGLPVMVSMAGLVTQAESRSARPAARWRAFNVASSVALVLERQQQVFETAVAPGGQFGKAARAGLGGHALDQLPFESIGELRLTQLVPVGLDRGLEVIEEVGHAAGPTGEMEGERRPHEGPAHAGPIGDGGIGIGDRSDALVDAIERLAPERRLQSVSEMAADLLVEPDRLLPD